jgi:GNAT superfamily N-acetyltransferase
VRCRRVGALTSRPGRGEPEIGRSRDDHLPQYVVVNLEVRRIRADEWRQYRHLRLEALKDSPLAFVEQYDDSLIRPRQFWQDRVARAAAGHASGIFVAVHGGRFIGTAGCFVEPEVTAYVSAHVVGVYVTPSWRGRGVAERLMAAILGWAREEAGATRVRLFVMATNDRAVALYRRVGFVPTGATMAYPPNPAMIEHEMEYRADT